MKFKFTKPVRAVIKECGIHDGTLRFAAGEARKLMHEFVPMDTGRLAESASEYVDDGRGRIIYNTPYARVCYYGEGRRFSREKNPKAGAFWDKSMMQVYKGALCRRVDKFIKKNRR